jgi:catechol 2,3-dioxygenase-like lactoylglutathione lyase family enzyme
MPDPPASDPPLPLRADDLEFLRKQAKQLLRAARNGDASAIARIGAIKQPLQLAHAQHAIAREAGFASWPKLQDELRFRQQVRRNHRLGSATPLKPGEIMSTTTISKRSLNLGPIDQIGLSCTDLDDAQRFYCDLLGLRLAGEALPAMKFFAADGVNIVMFKGDSVGPNSVIYFRVPGDAGVIEEHVAMLKSRGVKVESDAHVIARNWNGCDVWLAFFRDPFGNLLALKSDVPITK